MALMRQGSGGMNILPHRNGALTRDLPAPSVFEGRACTDLQGISGRTDDGPGNLSEQRKSVSVVLSHDAGFQTCRDSENLLASHRVNRGRARGTTLL